MKKNQISLQDETIAMQRIAAEIEKLPQEAKKRIVNWLVSIVGNIAQSSNIAPAQENGVPGQTNIIGPPTSKDESIKDFFHSKQPRNNYQKFAVLGYYLEFMKGKDEFGAQDLKLFWKQTREALPGQQVFTNALNDTLSNYNYFVAGEGRGLYRVGIKGQKLVEALPEQPKGVHSSKKRRKISSTKK